MKKQFIICTLLLILCFALAIHTGLIGIDYGTHWDEGKLVWSVQNSVKTGLYLPRWYSYPSFSYDLALVTLVPEIYRVVSENRKAYKEAYSMSKHNEASVRKAVWKQVKTNFTDKLYQRAIQYRFWLNIRIVFLVVSMLSMLWIFFFQGFWQRNYIEALFASMLFGFSWEVGYHARWIAPDLIMTQFITLTMLFLILAYSNIAHKRLFMLLTSISAGIAIGTKYTSWIIIIPIIITFFLIKRREKGALDSIFKYLFIIGLTYIITTPGMLIEPLSFLKNTISELRHYQRGHLIYSITPGFEHLYYNLLYIFTAFSSNTIIGIVLIIPLIGGIVYLLKEDRSMLFILLSFPVLYLIYMSMQRVMIVRNMLVILPFLAILSARGLFYLLSFLKLRIRIIALFLMTGLMAFNLYYLYKAAYSIKYKPDITKEVVSYLLKHPDDFFYASDDLIDDIKNQIGNIPGNLVLKHNEGMNLTILGPRYMLNHRDNVGANQYNYILNWFGSREVNLVHYPTWIGNHAIVLSLKDANKVGFKQPD